MGRKFDHGRVDFRPQFRPTPFASKKRICVYFFFLFFRRVNTWPGYCDFFFFFTEQKKWFFFDCPQKKRTRMRIVTVRAIGAAIYRTLRPIFELDRASATPRAWLLWIARAKEVREALTLSPSLVLCLILLVIDTAPTTPNLPFHQKITWVIYSLVCMHLSSDSDGLRGRFMAPAISQLQLPGARPILGWVTAQPCTDWRINR